MADRTFSWRTFLRVSSFAALAISHRPVRGTAPVSSEFQVNSYTVSDQYHVDLSVAANGAFVVVWTSYDDQDGYAQGIFAQRYDSSGVPQGAELQVNSFTDGFELRPRVAADADGDFVVVWEDVPRVGYVGQTDVRARRFTSMGGALASEFQVNTHTSSVQNVSSLAMDGDGDFIVAWTSYAQDGASGGGIFAQRFNSSGSKIAAEFQVNTYTPGTQNRPAVAAASDGRFVIAWDTDVDGDIEAVRAQRFDSGGAPIGGELAVNSFTVASQYHAAVGMDSGGAFVVVWSSFGQDLGSQGIFGRRWDSNGATVGAEFQVTTYTVGPQYLARNPTARAVGMDPDGDFFVVWTSAAQDGSLAGVFGQHWSSSGARLGPERQINTHVTGSQTAGAAAMDAAGNFVVAWQSDGQDGSDFGIFAQRFDADAKTLDVDGDGTAAALTDGLLIVRYLFGFRGAALILGAIGGGAERDTAPEVEAYIASILGVLDVDDNDALEPLADGLLILRYLFEFRGAVLTAGAIGAGADRDTAVEIETYLSGLV
jgi:hypothetical protein